MYERCELCRDPVIASYFRFTLVSYLSVTYLRVLSHCHKATVMLQKRLSLPGLKYYLLVLPCLRKYREYLKNIVI